MLAKESGVTIFELLICLAIAAIIMANAIPGFRDWQLRHEIDGAMEEVMSAIAMARAHAIAEGVTVTFCRSNDGNLCQGQWRDGSIVFIDRNADRKINENDRLLYRLYSLEPLGALTLNSFQNRQYLQITSRGFTSFQNGNFTYCSADGNARLNRQIIISLSGRTRYARDKDHDGVVENSQGRPVICK